MSKLKPPLFCHVARSPAKLNLRLKFVGRRPDGYHLLSMWNVLTTLYDELTIEIRECSSPVTTVDVINAPELTATPNIVEHAATAWMRANNKSWHVFCRLRKNIPIGAGMGGGSSNAAAILLALERFDGPSIPGQLEQIALQLGADVPFFLQSGAACVGGIGEIIHPFNVDCLKGRPCVVVMPDVALSSKLMYDAVRQKFPDLPGDIVYSPEVPPSTFSDMEFLFENDFESVAVDLCPKVAELLSIVRSDASVTAHMTGSGAAIFVLSRNDDGMEVLGEKVRLMLDKGGAASKVQCYDVYLVT